MVPSVTMTALFLDENSVIEGHKAKSQAIYRNKKGKNTG